MMTLRIGAAPISWGISEFPGWGPQLPYARVLDEMGAAGYDGTELGPWGFLPTDRAALAAALERRGLALAGAFVPLDLKDAARFDDAAASVRQTASLLSDLGAGHVLLADAGDEMRRRVAGRPTLTIQAALWEEEWPGYIDRLQRLAAICLETYHLVPCFHPHAGSYIEHPDEVAALMTRTDPGLLRLCLDTGHLAFGGADPIATARRYRDRLGYVHLKDIDLPLLRSLLAAGGTYLEAARRDVFVEPGRGSLDLPVLLAVLREAAYDGWIILEQDRVVRSDTDTLGSAMRSRAYLRARLGV